MTFKDLVSLKFLRPWLGPFTILLYQKRFIYRLLARHDFLPVWLVADK